MARARAGASIEIAAPVARVWEILGGFDNLPLWLGIIRSSRLEDGGRVRRLETAGGDLIVEQLLFFDEAEHGYSYRQVSAPDPVTDDVADVNAEAVGDGLACVSWSSSFTPLADEQSAVAHFASIYETALEELKVYVEARAQVEPRMNA